MSNPYISNYLANLQAAASNVASAFGGATLTVYSGLQPANANTALGSVTPLVTFTLPAAGSNTVTTSGTIVFGAISSANAYANGNASFFRITNGANIICDGDVGVSNANLVLPTVTLASGITVGVSSFVYTIVQ